jgi:hypothetical protein
MLCRWEPSGVLRVFQTRGKFALSGEDFIPSPDGGVWYTVSVSGFGGGVGMGRIGHLDANGVSTEYLVPNTLTIPASLALAPDGSLWYGQSGLMRFGVMAPPGAGPAKQPTVTTLSITPSQPETAPVTGVATVTAPGGGVPTGFVVFSYTGEAIPLTNGMATLTTSAAVQQAAYCCDVNCFGSLSQPFTVVGGLPSRVAAVQFGRSDPPAGETIPAPSTANSFDMTTDMSSANFLTGGTPTRTVTIVMDGTNTLGTGNLTPYVPFVGATPDGSNRFTVSGFGPGQHSIQAIYNGDANFDRIASLPYLFLGVAPSPLAATTTLSLSANSVPTGQAVTLTARVAARVSRKVWWISWTGPT